MRVHLKIALPIIGLALFGAESYHSFRVQREIERTANRYFWWSAIRLDSDPGNKPKQGTTSCKDAQENCGTWELRDRWVDPGLGAQFLMASALLAFIIVSAGNYDPRTIFRKGMGRRTTNAGQRARDQNNW